MARPGRLDCAYWPTHHTYHQPKRERTYWWMERWLRGNQQLQPQPEGAVSTFPPEVLKRLVINIPEDKGFAEIGRLFRNKNGYQAQKNLNQG